MEKPNEIGCDETTNNVEGRADDENCVETKSAIGAKAERLQESLNLLQENEPKLLHGLEKCRIDWVPLTIYVEGYEHCAQTVLVLLRCAHVYGVNLTIMPFPMRTVRDSTGDTRNGQT